MLSHYQKQIAKGLARLAHRFMKEVDPDWTDFKGHVIASI